MTSRPEDGSGFRLTVSHERVTLPNGRNVNLDVVRHPGASAVVPFVSDHDVLLIRQYRHATAGTILEIPAGKLDPGETPEACAIRELAEETGQRAQRLEKLGWIWTTPGFTDERIHLFAAFDLTPVPPQLDADEIIEVVRMSLDEALDRVWRGELTDAKSTVALMHAAHRLDRLR